MGLQVFYHKVCHCLTGFHGVTPHMWQENYIFKHKQLFRNLWLIFKHIEASPTQPAFEECRHKLWFINVWTSSNVDENALRTQGINDFTVDNVVGFFRQSTRNNEDLTIGSQVNDARVVLVICFWFLRS